MLGLWKKTLQQGRSNLSAPDTSGAEASGGSVGSVAAVPLKSEESVLSATAHPTTLQSRKRKHTIDGSDASLVPPSKKYKPTGDLVTVTSTIVDPVTGRNICLTNATTSVERLLRHLPPNDPFKHITWKTKENEGGFVCKVKIPEPIPIDSFRGDVASSAADAERNAHFRLCLALFNLGTLHHAMFPSDAAEHHPSNAQVVDSSSKPSKNSTNTRCYERRQPFFLARSLTIPPLRLFPVIIAINSPTYSPIILFTRQPLPPLAKFGIFVFGDRFEVCLYRGAPFDANEQEAQLLYKYTTRVSRSVLNKPLECTIESMPYLYGPLNSSFQAPPDVPWWRLVSVYGHIAWSTAARAADNWVTSLVPDGDKFVDALVDNCVVQDRHVEFTNRFYVAKVRQDLSPLSKPPDGTHQADHESFLEYCKSRSKDLRGFKSLDQPMLEVVSFPVVTNNLSPIVAHSKPEQYKSNTRYLIPELSFKFILPASTYRTALLLPSITHALERMLLAKEVNAKYFDNALNEEYLLQAVSPPTALVERDYERLELLGDAYLKYATSTFCFVTMIERREGPLHTARSQVVSNRALHFGAVKIDLPSYIQSKPLMPRIWSPSVSGPQGHGEDHDPGAAKVGQPGQVHKSERQPKLSKRQKQVEEQMVQWLGDKTVADVVEAIIGAALLSGGHDLAFLAAKTLQVQMPGIDKWSDFASRLPAPATPARPLSVHITAAVQKIAGHVFTQPSLIAEALTHGIAGGNGANYERLEYLGDAVLDIFSYIFERYPQLSPGGLSLLKAAMVSNSTLSAICVVTGLFEYIQLSAGNVRSAISNYAKKVRSLRDQEYKRALSESRLPGQFWLEAEPPKVLSDVLEALVGAIFVSDKLNISGAQHFFDTILKPFYTRHVRLHTLTPHPTTTLFEVFQAEHCQQHHMRKEITAKEIHCSVVVHGITVGSAVDQASNIAMRKAANVSLDFLNADPDFMTRVCDCRASQSIKKAQKKAQLGYEDEEDAELVERALIGELQ